MKVSSRVLSRAVLTALLAAVSIGAQAGPWKDEKHHGGDYKEEYWDGACKIERKWKGNGEYKEKSKCKGGPSPAVIYQPAPAVIVSPQAVIGQ